MHYDKWKDTDAVETMIYFLDAVITETISVIIILVSLNLIYPNTIPFLIRKPYSIKQKNTKSTNIFSHNKLNNIYFRGSDMQNKIWSVYTEYQETLLAYNAMDFDDLVVAPVKLFLSNKDCLNYWQKKINYLMVDGS